MSKVLLIHGAWHNEKCWEKVVELLEEKGHEAVTLTIPGNGPDDSKDVAYEDYTEHVAKVIKEQEGKVTVLGHSSAGHIIQMSVPKASEKVEKVIFNDAWILPDGTSQFDFIPDEIKNGMRAQAKASGNGAIPIDPNFVKGMLATEASEERFNELMSILISQPLVIMETKINAKEFASLDIPKVMLNCTKDVSAAPGAYVEMFKVLGDNPVVDVECDHEGLFTNPEVYAEGLIKCLEI